MSTTEALASFEDLAVRKIDDDAHYQWRIARRHDGNVRPDLG